MSKKWRIDCTVHGYQYVWSDTLPVCPIVAADPLVAGNESIVGKEIPVLTVMPVNMAVNSSNYSRILAIPYDTEYYGQISRVKALGSMHMGIASYDIEVYDKDTHTSLLETNFTNSGDLQEIDLGVISSPPIGNFGLEINVKKNGGGKKKTVHIHNVTFYTRT